MQARRLTLATLLVALSFASQDVVPVDFQTLAGFEWQEGQALPENVRRLSGKKIGIQGFVRSLDGSDEQITAFWLIDQNCDCAGIPRMNEYIVCVMPEGRSFSNDGRPVRVTGKLEVGEVREGDYVTSIYRLSVESID
ncbi:MAG TPA: DUF3299 domain-containing protein [Planctomycetota bacterium]|nr:DUF3299 domain-containing protein [Planctomycetota bacterium]